MASPWIFVCPSTRGIGHAVTRHLLRTTSLPILATARPHHDTETVKESLLSHLPGGAAPSSADAAARERMAARLSVVHADAASDASLAAAASRAAALFPRSEYHLRLAVALPGILHPEKHPSQIDEADSLETFRTNAVAPLLLMKHFHGFLPRRGEQLAGLDDDDDDAVRLPAHATWLSGAARVGSTADNRLGGWFSYRASKAAVISAARTYDVFLRARCGDSALSVAYHPGTVRTDLSRDFWAGVPEGKLFSPEFAAERLVSVVCGLQPWQRGRCWDWDGKEVPP